jgi:hypothetical protein
VVTAIIRTTLRSTTTATTSIAATTVVLTSLTIVHSTVSATSTAYFYSTTTLPPSTTTVPATTIFLAQTSTTLSTVSTISTSFEYVTTTLPAVTSFVLGSMETIYSTRIITSNYYIETSTTTEIVTASADGRQGVQAQDYQQGGPTITVYKTRISTRPVTFYQTLVSTITLAAMTWTFSQLVTSTITQNRISTVVQPARA